MPGYGRRHDIRPGITGLAQVNGTYYTDPGFKLGHDLQYLVNWSPVLDIQILFRTVYVVLARRCEGFDSAVSLRRRRHSYRHGRWTWTLPGRRHL